MLLKRSNGLCVPTVILVMSHEAGLFWGFNACWGEPASSVHGGKAGGFRTKSHTAGWWLGAGELPGSLTSRTLSHEVAHRRLSRQRLSS